MLERIATTTSTLFETHGYDAVTMEQIAATAEVSKRTLYQHFSAKDAVLAHILESELARDLAGHKFSFDAKATFRKSVSLLLADSAAWCKNHPDYLLPYIRYKFATFHPDVGAASDGGMVQAWAALISLGQRNGELSSKCSAEQLAIYFHYLYLGALMRWITAPRLKLEHEFQTIVDLFIDGAGH